MAITLLQLGVFVAGPSALRAVVVAASALVVVTWRSACGGSGARTESRVCELGATARA
jgi:hypothetical protein